MLLDSKPSQAPVFVQSPKSAKVTPGRDVTLSVSCAGTRGIKYQGYRDGTLNPDATSTVVSLPNVRSNTTVWVEAVNAYGTTTSAAGTISIDSLRGPVFAWGANQYTQCDVPA